MSEQQAALAGEVATSGARGRDWGTPGCWGRAGSAEHEPSAAAVSQLQVTREGCEVGRKDVAAFATQRRPSCFSLSG